jgi:competence protein ComEC
VRPARDALVLPAASFAAGIAASSLLSPDFYHLLFAAGGLGFLVAVSVALHARIGLWAAVLALSTVSGAISFELHRPGPAPVIETSPGELLLLSGCVAGPVDSDGIRSRFLLELEPDTRARVTVTAREGERLPAITYGQQIELTARLRQPRNFANPGAFDYVRYLRRHSVYWTASARGADSVRLLPGDCGTPVMRAAMRLRERVVSRIRELYGADSWNGRVLPALLVGETAAGDRSWTEDYRRTGTYHALVVSGLHIAVVAGSILFLLRILSVPLGTTALLASFVAWTYAAVVSWQPPAVRAAAGFTLFLIAAWFYRRGRVLNLLAAAVIAFLALDPEALFDASFQLTVVSVAAIGGLAAPMIEGGVAPWSAGFRALGNADRDRTFPFHVAEFRIELRLLAETAALLTRTRLEFWCRAAGLSGRLLCWATETAIVSGCIQAALAVPMVAYFHTISLTSVLANITVAPALTAAVPAAFLACIFDWRPLLAITGGLLEFSRVAAAFWASLEPAWRIPDPPLAVAVATTAALSALALSLVLRVHRVVTGLAGLVAAGALVALWTGAFSRPNLTQELEVTAIDVGQGESLLVAEPGGRTLLVDGGGIPNYDPRYKAAIDIGEDVVSPYLWRRQIRRLHAVAITHLHEDHAGGMPALIRNFRPSELWIGAAPPGQVWDEVRQAAETAGTRIVRLEAGIDLSLGAVAVRVLAPLAGYVPDEKPRNEDSLVLHLRYGERTFLLTGDADGAIEFELNPGEVDVLKVAHHGSRSSTAPELLERVRPLFGVISAGEGKQYGHPHPELQARLRAAGFRNYYTEKDGLTTIRTDGKRIRVEDFIP